MMLRGPSPVAWTMRISIEGNVGSGKSELLRRLQLQGHHVVQEPVDAWTTVLSRFYVAKQRWAMTMNLTALLSFVDIPAQCQNGGPVVVERSPLSCLEVFARMHKNEGVMSEKEWQLCQDLHSLTAWTPDVIVYLLTPPATCWERVQSRGRLAEDGVDHEYLSKLHFAHGTMMRWFTGEIHLVDSTQDAGIVASRVHDILEGYQT